MMNLVKSVMKEVLCVDCSDVSKSFFAYGVDSLDLMRVGHALNKALKKELPLTFLLDNPTVRDLVAHLHQIGVTPSRTNPAEGDGKGSSLEVVKKIMSEMKYPIDMNNMSKHFFEYGMDSIDLVRFSHKLSHALEVKLSTTLLFDFPSVGSLVDHLNKERAFGEQRSEDVKIDAGFNSRLPALWRRVYNQKMEWNEFDARDLIELQDLFVQTFRTPEFQSRVIDCFERSYPDKIKYLLHLDDILKEVEGRILLARGLCSSVDSQEVKRSRLRMQECVMKFWRDVPAVRNKGEILMQLTKQDVDWPQPNGTHQTKCR